jgi:predicted DNA-binding transcriptional regulator AlpA
MPSDKIGHDERPSTLAEIKEQWPPAVDVPTAGAAFGLSRSHSYDLVTRGQFPATVLKLGKRYRVLTESIIRVLSDEVG